MRIIFIRHGDPDYVNDTLTDRGHIEAKALAEHISYWGIDDAYQSPLGRAMHTAEYSLNALGKSAITCDWLREFNPVIDVNVHLEWLAAYPNTRKNSDGNGYETRICWDMVPGYLNENPIYYTNPGWREGEICLQSDVLQKYDYVCNEFDKLLATYGYVRDGYVYRVEKESTKTIGLFCHYGVTCVILSHLMNTSPFSLWNGTCLAPTAVTEVATEERQQGIAQFRTLKYGDVSHLIKKDIEPSFAARFAEVYSDFEKRH